MGVCQGRVEAVPPRGAEPFLGDEEQPADVVERVALATPMSLHVLLRALTDLGDDLVPQPDHVQSGPRSRSLRVAASVAGVRYPRHGSSATTPTSARPSAVSEARKPLAAAPERPWTTSMSRPVSRSQKPVAHLSGRDLQRCSTRPRRPHTGQRTQLFLDHRFAELPHRVHDRGPANPKRAGHRRHRGAVLADPPSRVAAGPLRQHRPQPDQRTGLRPGLAFTGRLRTAPDMLGPHQHRRAAPHRQIPHPCPASSFRPCPGSATRTAHHIRVGLYQHQQLAVVFGRGRRAAKAHRPSFKYIAGSLRG